jgi:response regulator RpfG family c-di-GMP phosphodiesterase
MVQSQADFSLAVIIAFWPRLDTALRLRYLMIVNTAVNSSKPKILCVDDEVDNLDALERIFRKTYQVYKAISAKDAVLLLKSHPDVSVIISDQRMPGISGVEFLEGTVLTHPESIRILLTGYTDIESVITAINKGQIFRYITKPWDTTDLTNTVDRAFEKFQLRQELRQKNEELQNALQELQMLDKTKSQFMILINHELKTPLTAILSFAALLKETVLSEEQRLFVDRINRSSEKLKSIIDDVLLIVKGEMGLIKVNKEKMSCEHFFKNWPPDFIASIASKNQTLKCDLISQYF